MVFFTGLAARRLRSILVQSWIAAAVLGCGGGGGGGGATSDSPDSVTAASVSSFAVDRSTIATVPVVAAPFAAWTAALSDLAEDGTAYGVAAPTVRTLTNQTVRQVARAAVSGDSIRLKFSNQYGRSPITFTKVRVARTTGAGAIDVGSDMTITFGASPTVTIPAGTETWSDPVALPVAAGRDISVSVYVQGSAEFITAERFSQQTQYTASGDTTSAGNMSMTAASATRYWLAEMDVIRNGPTNVVVAFGDSITQGLGSTAGANRRYTDFLQARITQAATYPPTSIVNMGITGNRWLHDVPGPRGVQRFERDVLRVTGVSHAVVLLGINDFGAQAITGQQVTAEAVMAAMSSIAAAGRKAGIEVVFGTLLPFKGHPVYSAQNEAMRQAVNAWIRTNPSGAGFIDFDAALRNPADPGALLAAYDSGDHEHPSDAGYQRMAEAVDLATLR